MTEGFSPQTLPKSRTGRHLQWLAHSSWPRIGVFGLLGYLAIVLLSSSIECMSLWRGLPMVMDSTTKSAAGYGDILYFNFITILTIGYGDFVPVHFGRLISALEALLGAGLFALLISVVTAKILAAPANAVVFSRFAYYCTDDQRFLIIFVNTTRGLLENVDISSYMKLGGDWVVDPPVRTPFIGQSVWTFHMNRIQTSKLASELDKDDVLRCALTGQIGSTTFSAVMQYSTNEILVIPNRDELTAFPGFWNADLASEQVIKMFHYQPDGAPTLASFVATQRSETRPPSG